MIEKRPMTDEQLDRLLASLKETAETDACLPSPPVVNTFRLQMEAERRRSRRQVQIVTLAAWFSVTATLAVLAYFALVLFPALEPAFTPEMKHFLAQIRQSAHACSGLFIATGVALLLGYVFSSVLLIAKKDTFFQRNDP